MRPCNAGTETETETREPGAAQALARKGVVGRRASLLQLACCRRIGSGLHLCPVQKRTGPQFDGRPDDVGIQASGSW